MHRPYRLTSLGAGAAFVAIHCLSVLTSTDAAAPARLRYDGKKDQQLGYRIEIVADRDEATETLAGVVTYKVISVDNGVLRVTYSGGLGKSSKAKPSQGSSRFGPSRFGPPMFPSRAFGPFSRTPFKGLVTTTNELTLTSTGEIQSMRGDSQLPYLLGNASLLVFEPLPEQPEQSWSVSTGISITEEGGREGLPFRHLPFATEESKRTTAGSEVLTYHVRSTEGPHVIIDKTYRLDSPAVSEDVSGFEINGTGTWTFNRELGLTESIDFQQKLVVQKGNTTVAYPMTIQCTRMSDAEFTAYREEQEKRQEEARKQLAERQEREAKTPLTEAEIQKILADLQSDNTSVVLMALQKLQAKSPQASDPRIATAVDALRGHENIFVRQNVDKVAEKWPLPEGVLPAAAKRRTWHDSTGTFTVDAEFLRLEGDTVHLRRDDGKLLQVPLQRLSQTDQQAAREMAKAPEAIDNPFD